MKKFLIIMFLFCSLTFAQVIDTLNYSSNDSIDLKAIVQKQIDEAIKKNSVAKNVETTYENEIFNLKEEKENSKVNNASFDSFAKIFTQLPLQYRIYLSLSLLIVLFVLLRRTFIQFKRKSIKKLKERIALLREEKIGGSIVNQKKRQIRLTLKDNPITLKQNEKEIALNAKQLNISKGELLLAARLKLLEVSKAQRSL